MKTPIKILIVAALAVTVVAAVALKQGKNETKDASTAALASPPADAGSKAGLPRLMNLKPEGSQKVEGGKTEKL